jgi:hypothetical protein
VPQIILPLMDISCIVLAGVAIRPVPSFENQLQGWAAQRGDGGGIPRGNA